MDRYVTWVHGIGDHQVGYSERWRTNFDRYLHLPRENYIEVLWETVLDRSGATRADDPDAIILSPAEQAAEAEVRAEIELILLARENPLANGDGAPATRGGEVIEFGQAGTRGFIDWLRRPNEYLGDFTRYLVSRNVRRAVRDKFKERVRPLAGEGRISVIAHSWGSVVAYDSLIELTSETPDLRIGALVTLGSPLWIVRRLLDDRSGHRPGNVDAWVNVHARDDAVGSWLTGGFAVDKDYQVPCAGGRNCHSSYFVEDNEQVQKDIVSPYVLM